VEPPADHDGLPGHDDLTLTLTELDGLTLTLTELDGLTLTLTPNPNPNPDPNPNFNPNFNPNPNPHPNFNPDPNPNANPNPNQVPMFAASGLHVRFLKVFEKSNYQTIKWVRYITKAGQYQHRI
jgi:hypothetical protein